MKRKNGILVGIFIAYCCVRDVGRTSTTAVGFCVGASRFALGWQLPVSFVQFVREQECLVPTSLLRAAPAWVQGIYGECAIGRWPS